LRELVTDDRCRTAGIVGELIGLMRMDADREPDLGPETLDRAPLLRFRLIARGQNHERAFESGSFSVCDDDVEIGRECLVSEMTVRVDHAFRIIPRDGVTACNWLEWTLSCSIWPST
jgi:hypothetical protein